MQYFHIPALFKRETKKMSINLNDELANRSKPISQRITQPIDLEKLKKLLEESKKTH